MDPLDLDEVHEEQCEHGLKKGLHGLSLKQAKEDNSTALLMEICTRIQKCEHSTMEKEKDLAQVIFNMHELKEQFNEKEKEVDLLKVKNVAMEEEINLVKELNQGQKVELEFLRNQGQLIQKKVDSLDSELLETKNIMQGKNVETLYLKKQIEELKSEIIKKKKSSHKEIEMIKSAFSKPHSNNELLKVNEVSKTVKEVTSTSHPHNSLNGNEVIDLVAPVNITEKLISEYNMLKTEVTKNNEEITLLNDWRVNVDKGKEDMEAHVDNIENVLFSNQGSIQLKWVIHNYQQRFELGEDVSSPIFYIQVNGYSFQLLVRWHGESKEKLGLYLYLWRGRNYYKALEPFMMKYTFEIPDKDGKRCSRTIPLPHIVANRVEAFTIHRNENRSRKGGGPWNMLTMPTLPNYIINDMLTVYCTLEQA